MPLARLAQLERLELRAHPEHRVQLVLWDHLADLPARLVPLALLALLALVAVLALLARPVHLEGLPVLRVRLDLLDLLDRADPRAASSRPRATAIVSSAATRARGR